MAIDMNQTFDRASMQRQRQRAVLITIDYDGVSFRGDDELFRGKAIVINAPQGFAYGDRESKVVHIDREISGDMVRHGRMTIEDLKRREFAYMEAELLKASRELAAHGPEVTLIPMHEYRALGQRINGLRGDIDRQKEENLHLARQSTVVRNDALRWKALATKLRLQRDASLGARIKRLVRRWLRP